jgi:hypothetical protein
MVENWFSPDVRKGYVERGIVQVRMYEFTFELIFARARIEVQKPNIVSGFQFSVMTSLRLLILWSSHYFVYRAMPELPCRAGSYEGTIFGGPRTGPPDKSRRVDEVNEQAQKVYGNMIFQERGAKTETELNRAKS